MVIERSHVPFLVESNTFWIILSVKKFSISRTSGLELRTVTVKWSRLNVTALPSAVFAAARFAALTKFSQNETGKL